MKIYLKKYTFEGFCVGRCYDENDIQDGLVAQDGPRDDRLVGIGL